MGEGNCLSRCIKIIFAAGVIAVLISVIWLLCWPPGIPKCSIEYLYVPALNKSLNSSKPLNTTLNFMVRLDNPNIMYRVYYDDVVVSISNTFNTSNSSLLAIYTIPGFYQGFHKKAKKWGQVLPFNNHSLLQAVLPNGSAVFLLELKTRVRFHRLFGNKYGLEVGANVEVNGEGAKATNEEIKMKKSHSSSPLTSSFSICVLMNLLVFFAIS